METLSNTVVSKVPDLYKWGQLPVVPVASLLRNSGCLIPRSFSKARKFSQLLPCISRLLIESVSLLYLIYVIINHKVSDL
jgi:hypothetical protein